MVSSNEKGFSGLILLILIVVCIGILGAVVYFSQSQTLTLFTQKKASVADTRLRGDETLHIVFNEKFTPDNPYELWLDVKSNNFFLKWTQKITELDTIQEVKHSYLVLNDRVYYSRDKFYYVYDLPRTMIDPQYSGIANEDDAYLYVQATLAETHMLPLNEIYGLTYAVEGIKKVLKEKGKVSSPLSVMVDNQEVEFGTITKVEPTDFRFAPPIGYANYAYVITTKVGDTKTLPVFTSISSDTELNKYVQNYYERYGFYSDGTSEQTRDWERVADIRMLFVAIQEQQQGNLLSQKWIASTNGTINIDAITAKKEKVLTSLLPRFLAFVPVDPSASGHYSYTVTEEKLELKAQLEYKGFCEGNLAKDPFLKVLPEMFVKEGDLCIYQISIENPFLNS